MSDEANRKARALRELAVSKTRALVRELADHAALARHHGDDGAYEHADVILQTDVDGLRCVLRRHARADATAPPTLSPREREIARLIAYGHQNKVVADRLSISVWTVNTHVRRIFHKFGVTSRAAMARRMAEHALLD